MAKRLLFATLGTTPAVVTVALDLLKKENIEINGVFLFLTKDSDVQTSLQILQEHLSDHDHISWIVPVMVQDIYDINSSEAAVDFMNEACMKLKQFRDRDIRIYVSIAGGRKAMSVLMALAVQFYGAERLFHVWVPPWIEEEGDVNKVRIFRNDPEEITAKLHPPLDGDESSRPRLVALPFVGLFPFLDEIRRGLLGGEIRTKEIKRLLVENNLITTGGKPTELGQMVWRILERVEGLPPARKGQCIIHIGKHHYRDRLEKFARELSEQFAFIRAIRSAEWRQGEDKVKSEPPNRIRIFKHLGTEISFQLILETTATSEGELEVACREIKRYLKL